MAFTTFTILTVFVVSVSTNTITDKSTFSCQLTCSPLGDNECPSNTTALLTILNGNSKIPQKTQQLLSDELYNKVTAGDYEAAVTKSLQLNQDGYSRVIIDTVKKLLNDNEKNIVEFAYKLWNMFGKNIVQDYFPLEFRILFNQNTFELVDKKYRLFTAVSSIAPNGNPRLVYGRKPDERVKFILKPIWEDDRVYFKFEDTTYHTYVFLADLKDGENNLVYSGNCYNTHSHQWSLHPSVHEGDLLFYIVCRQFERALKFSDFYDNERVQRMHGSKDEYANKPTVFGWYIRPI